MFLHDMRYHHYCELKPQEFPNQKSLSPYASIFGRLRYKLKRFTTIDPQNFYCRQYFRSQASKEAEKRRHIRNPEYRYIIHPFSKFNTHKRTGMAILWMILFFVDPFISGFVVINLHPDKLDTGDIDIILNVLVVPDIVLNFFTGFTIEQTREVVLTPRRIIKRYLTTYFFLDFIPVVACFLSYAIPNLPIYEMVSIQTFEILRYSRFKTIVEFIHDTCDRLKFKESTRICISLILFTVLLLHWFTCLLSMIPMLEKAYTVSDESWSDLVYIEQEFRPRPDEFTNYADYNTSMLLSYAGHYTVTISHFFGIGIDSFATADTWETFYLGIVMMLGIGYYTYVTARIVHLFGLINFSQSKYEELVKQAKEYAVVKRFPRELRNRIMLYYEYKFDRKFFMEKLIMDTLTEHLRMEILLYSCRNLLERVQVFQGLGKPALGCILARLKHEIFLPNDCIMNYTNEKNRIYFLLFGTCNVLLAEDQSELMHIEDGYHFGEMNSHLRSRGLAIDVYALETSDIYYLERGDLRFCIMSFPEVKEKLLQASAKKLKQYTDLSIFRDTDELKTDEITLRLRRGKILNKGDLRE